MNDPSDDKKCWQSVVRGQASFICLACDHIQRAYSHQNALLCPKSNFPPTKAGLASPTAMPIHRWYSLYRSVTEYGSGCEHVLFMKAGLLSLSAPKADCLQACLASDQLSSTLPPLGRTRVKWFVAQTTVNLDGICMSG